MPEPLSLDPSLVAAPSEATIAASYPSPTRFVGASRAAPAKARLRVTNLDTPDPVVETTTNGDGSFTLLVVVDIGQELRFQAIVDGARRIPVDVRVEADHSFTPVTRPACIEIEPGYTLELGARAAQRELRIRNACTDAVLVENARSRLGVPDFTLPTGLPLTIAPRSEDALSVGFTPAGAVPSEDVLFVDATLAGTAVRYAFTLVGGTP